MNEMITAYVPRPSLLKEVDLTYSNRTTTDTDRAILPNTLPDPAAPSNAPIPNEFHFEGLNPYDNPIQEDFPLPPEVVDMVNHPSHYALEKYECKEVLKEVLKDLDGYEGFCIGNVIKYCWRLKRKGKPIEDAKKAAFYINDCIEYMKAKEEPKDVSLP